MKRVLVVLVVAVLASTMVVGAFADSDRKQLADSMMELTKQILSELAEKYDKDGKLSDGDLELAFGYYKLYLSLKRVSDIESLHPIATYLNLGMDANANIEDAINEFWLKALEDKGNRENFEELLFMMIKMELGE